METIYVNIVEQLIISVVMISTIDRSIEITI